MDRRSFLSKLAIGAAAVVVAPQVLMAKPEPTIIGTAEMLDMQKSLMNNIIEIPPYGWYTQAEMEAVSKMREQMEWSMMFGKIDKMPYKTGGIWNTLS